MWGDAPSLRHVSGRWPHFKLEVRGVAISFRQRLLDNSPGEYCRRIFYISRYRHQVNRGEFICCFSHRPTPRRIACDKVKASGDCFVGRPELLDIVLEVFLRAGTETADAVCQWADNVDFLSAGEWRRSGQGYGQHNEAERSIRLSRHYSFTIREGLKVQDRSPVSMCKSLRNSPKRCCSRKTAREFGLYRPGAPSWSASGRLHARSGYRRS